MLLEDDSKKYPPLLLVKKRKNLEKIKKNVFGVIFIYVLIIIIYLRR